MRVLSPSVIAPVLIVSAVAAMVVTANLRQGRRSGRPFTPASRSGANVATREGLEQRIAEMEATLKERPDDFAAAVALVDALMRQSRVTGNAGLMLRAEQTLHRALIEDPGNYDVRRMQASLYLSQHRFDEGLAMAESLANERPDDPVNFGIIGDAHLEIGDYEAAFDAFDRMMQLRPGAASYARVAYARELQGNLTGALESMQLAAGASEGGDREAVAWYRAQVGELYLRLDRPADAMQAFALASQAFPGHPFAVIGYAKSLERLGRLDEACALLEDFVKKSPTPDLHALLGDFEAKAGRMDAAARQWALAEAAWRSDAPEPKNLARFLAERGQKVEEAVRIAEAAAAIRHDIFTEDALAWAYFKAGRIVDAKRTIKLALRTGTKDVDILRHARAIEAAPIQLAVR